MLLRAIHGEVYTLEKLARYRLIDDATCPRCSQDETLCHKIFECTYVDRIWTVALRLMNSSPNLDRLQAILGVHSDPALLPLHCEILKRILHLPRTNEFLIHPKHFVKLAIKCVLSKERADDVKTTLGNLLLAL